MHLRLEAPVNVISIRIPHSFIVSDGQPIRPCPRVIDLSLIYDNIMVMPRGLRPVRKGQGAGDVGCGVGSGTYIEAKIGEDTREFLVPAQGYIARLGLLSSIPKVMVTRDE